MASILFIDDDPVFLEAITEYFQDLATENSSPQRTRVYSAQGARKAITILKQAKINVTVTDIKLREVDGIQFLQMLTKHFPNMSKVVLSTLPADDNREPCVSAGAMVYLEKAKSRDEVKQVIASIKAVLATSADEYSDLGSNAEVRAMFARFCAPGVKLTLFVKTDKVVGRVIIFDGHIVHCAASKLIGLDALKYLLTRDSAQYKTDEYEKPSQITVKDGTWESLVGVQPREIGAPAPSPSSFSGVVGHAPGQGPSRPTMGSGMVGRPPGQTPTGKSASDIARAAIRPVTGGSGLVGGSGLAGRTPSGLPSNADVNQRSGIRPVTGGSGLAGRQPSALPQNAELNQRSGIRPVTGGSGLAGRTPGVTPPSISGQTNESINRSPLRPNPDGSGLAGRLPSLIPPGNSGQVIDPANRPTIRPVTGGSGLAGRPPSPIPAAPAARPPMGGAPQSGIQSPGQQRPAPQNPAPQKPVTPKPEELLEIEDDDLYIDELTKLDDDTI